MLLFSITFYQVKCLALVWEWWDQSEFLFGRVEIVVFGVGMSVFAWVLDLDSELAVKVYFHFS